MLKPYKLASREFSPEPTVVRVADGPGRSVGGRELAIIAGPCSVESRRGAGGDGASRGSGRCRDAPRRRIQAPHLAVRLPGAGRGRAALPGRGARETGLADRHRGDGHAPGRAGRRATPTCCRSARATCRTSRCWPSSAEWAEPVLLKRGLSATIKELLMAAEYIMANGNPDVDAVRARHPHLRDGDPQHAGHRGDSGAQA